MLSSRILPSRMVEYLTSPSGCRFAIRIKNPLFNRGQQWLGKDFCVSMLSQFLWWSNCSIASQRTGYLPDHSERYEALFQFFYSPSVSWALRIYRFQIHWPRGASGPFSPAKSVIKHELRLIVAQAKILFVKCVHIISFLGATYKDFCNFVQLKPPWTIHWDLSYEMWMLSKKEILRDIKSSTRATIYNMGTSRKLSYTKCLYFHS